MCFTGAKGEATTLAAAAAGPANAITAAADAAAIATADDCTAAGT